MQEAATLVKTHGQIIMLGVCPANASIFPLIWFAKEINLSFSLGYNLREFGDSISLLSRGVVDPEVVTSDVVPLAEIGDAFKALHGSGHTKILVDCS